jgi:hypothetical protein
MVLAAPSAALSKPGAIRTVPSKCEGDDRSCLVAKCLSTLRTALQSTYPRRISSFDTSYKRTSGQSGFGWLNFRVARHPPRVSISDNLGPIRAVVSDNPFGFATQLPRIDLSPGHFCTDGY